MARSAYIYRVFDVLSHRELGLFTVKHKAVSFAQRLIRSSNTEWHMLALHRAKDGLREPPPQVWERVDWPNKEANLPFVVEHDMSSRSCVDALEQLGSDQDPIIFRRKDTTPRDLLYSLGDETIRACTIRISFYGDHGLTHSNLLQMLKQRVRMVKRGELIL